MSLTTVILLIALALICNASAQAATTTVEWIRQIGTSGTDQSLSVAVDLAGNAYISGNTEGSLGGVNAGDFDAFLTKFDSSGNELWTKQIGTSSYDHSYSVAVDVRGNAFISGSTTGTLGGANSGFVDAFLTKFDGNGNQLWTSQFGTSSTDISTSVAVDAAGDAYVSGVTHGSLGNANAGGGDAFLAKVDSNGHQLWTSQIGTSRYDRSSSVAVDAAGNVYITGSTEDVLGAANAGVTDAFLTKFDSSGNELWTEQFGTNSNDEGQSVVVDAAGNAYISGFTWGSLGRANAGSGDAFLTKFDSSGNRLWTEQIGTSSYDHSYSVAVDTVGDAYITGSTSGSLGRANAGFADAFLTKFDKSGNYLWTEQIGTGSNDISRSVAVHSAGSVYISGTTRGRLGGVRTFSADAFLVKYRIVPEPSVAALAAVAGVSGLGVRRRV